LWYSRFASIAICLLTVLLAVKPPDLIAWLGNAAFGFFVGQSGPSYGGWRSLASGQLAGRSGQHVHRRGLPWFFTS
jgi:hypothetical protein